jgi:predicted GNAT family N-acyltransferase
MTDFVIKIANLLTDSPQIFKIRYQVFQIEQGVDPSLEFDDQEEQATHLLAYLNQKAVGTARLRMLDPYTAKIERVAVLSEARGLGIGRRIMETALEVLKSANVAEVQIHAQEQVRNFYLSLGFVPEGAGFEEAGIPHVKMKRRLQ